jgi:hypothetical protein
MVVDGGVFVGVGVLVATGEFVAVDVGVLVGAGVLVVVAVGVGAVVSYLTCNSGAPEASPLYASAVRFPLPVMIAARALPLDQPERLTISWMTAAIFGVR